MAGLDQFNVKDFMVDPLLRTWITEDYVLFWYFDRVDYSYSAFYNGVYRGVAYKRGLLDTSVWSCDNVRKWDYTVVDSPLTMPEEREKLRKMLE